MAIRGLRPNSTVKYILKRDPARGENGEDIGGATVFVLSTLTGYARAMIRDMQMSVGGDSEKMAEGAAPQVKMSIYAPAYEACRLGIADWINFQNEDGTPIPFEKEETIVGGKRVMTPTRNTIGLIDVDDAFELMGVILSGAAIMKVDEKKSDAASLPTSSSPKDSATTAPVNGNGAATPAA
jgi:hypothetical protein